MNLFEKIIQLLDENKINYQLLNHEPVYTSQQAAAVRPDISLHQGAKAMLLKVENGKGKMESDQKFQLSNFNSQLFVMVVVPGDQKIDYRKVSKFLGVRDVELASAEEVERTVGVKIGAVSPLGNLSGLRVLIDEGLLKNDQIAFNAGDHSKTVVMRAKDYLQISEGRTGNFAKLSSQA